MGKDHIFFLILPEIITELSSAEPATARSFIAAAFAICDHVDGEKLQLLLGTLVVDSAT